MLQFKLSLLCLLSMNQGPVDFLEVPPGNFFVKGGAAGWTIAGGGADAGVGDTDHGAPVFDFQAWLGQSVQTGWSNAPICYTPLRKSLHEHP